MLLIITKAVNKLATDRGQDWRRFDSPEVACKTRWGLEDVRAFILLCKVLWVSARLEKHYISACPIPFYSSRHLRRNSPFYRLSGKRCVFEREIWWHCLLSKWPLFQGQTHTHTFRQTLNSRWTAPLLTAAIYFSYPSLVLTQTNTHTLMYKRTNSRWSIALFSVCEWQNVCGEGTDNSNKRSF